MAPRQPELIARRGPSGAMPGAKQNLALSAPTAGLIKEHHGPLGVHATGGWESGNATGRRERESEG